MTKTELVTLLLMAVGLWLLVQFSGLKFWHAVVVFAAGFYLAEFTASGPQVHAWVTSLLHAFGH